MCSGAGTRPGGKVITDSFCTTESFATAAVKSDNLRTIIALAVAFCWVVAVLSSVVTRQYKTLEVVTPVMMVVTGFLFGYQIQVNRSTGKNGVANRRKEDKP